MKARYIYLLAFQLILSINYHICYAQTEKHITEYETSQQAAIDSTLKLFSSKQKTSILDYIPGITYSSYVHPDGTYNSGLSISYSFSQLRNNILSSKQNKIETTLLKQRHSEQLSNEITRLQNKHLEIQTIVVRLANEIQAFKPYYQNIIIKKEKYKKLEISLEQWLEAQKSYLQSFYNLINTLHKIELNYKQLYNQINAPGKWVNSTEHHTIQELERRIQTYKLK